MEAENKIISRGQVKSLFECYLDEYEAFLRYKFEYLDPKYGVPTIFRKYSNEEKEKYNALFDQILKSEKALNLSHAVIEDIRETLIEKIKNDNKIRRVK